MGEIYPEASGVPYEDTPDNQYTPGIELPDAVAETVTPFGPVEDAPSILTPPKPPRVPDHTQSKDNGGNRAKKSTSQFASRVPVIPASKVEAQLVKPLTEIYQFVGGLIMMFDQYCALPWVNGAEERARSVAEIAQRNDAVRKALLFLVESSDAAQLMMLHAPLVMAPIMHHAPIGPKLSDEQIAAFLASQSQTGDNES